MSPPPWESRQSMQIHKNIKGTANSAHTTKLLRHYSTKTHQETTKTKPGTNKSPRSAKKVAKQLTKAIATIKHDKWLSTIKGSTIDEIVHKAIQASPSIPEEIPIKDEIGKWS